MRIIRTGNVGIGTTTPTKPLDVVGEIRSTGGFRFYDGTLQSTASLINNVTAGAGLTGGGTTGAVTLDINTGTGLSVAADSISVNYGSSPGTAVQGNTTITVAGDGMSGGNPLTLGAGGTLTLNNIDKGSSQSIFKNVANAAGTTQFSAGANNDSILFAGTGGTSVTFDAGSKKITVDSSSIVSSQWNTNGSNIDYSAGNVGIGITTPTSKLHVVGSGHVTQNFTVDGVINAKYQDVAEWVPSTHALPAGTVVTLDPTK